MSSVVIEQTASRLEPRILHKAAEKHPNYGFIDPITILMIISIMVGVIRIIQECQKNKLKKLSDEEKINFYLNEIKSKAKNPGLLAKWRIQKVIKRAMSKEQYKYFGDSVYETLQELGERIKEEQVSSLLEYKNV